MVKKTKKLRETFTFLPFYLFTFKIIRTFAPDLSRGAHNCGLR